jgi:hypothetical protein
MHNIDIGLLTNQDILSLPGWRATEDNPPISARQALIIADRCRRERLIDKENSKWGLESLTLYPLDSDSNKWCWRVMFTPDEHSSQVGGRGLEFFRIFVLMDGEVLMPDDDLPLELEVAPTSYNELSPDVSEAIGGTCPLTITLP